MSKINCYKYLIFGLLSLLYVSAEDTNNGEKNECYQEIRFYSELKCKAIYKNRGNRCVDSYDCSNLNNRSLNKCYAYGHAYAVDTNLSEADQRLYNLCRMGCRCIKFENNEIPKFYCAIVDCFFPPPSTGCYRVQDLNRCCGSEVRCPKNTEERGKCTVDGNTYLEGQIFYPKNTDWKCLCTKKFKNITGKTIPSYCKRTKCGLEINYPLELKNYCAPIYEADQTPIYSCPYSFRCQNSNDTVIHTNAEHPPQIDKNVCKFGNLKLHVGDRLKQSNQSPDECVECVCKTPPFLTCYRIPDDKCKIKSIIKDKE